MSLREREEAQGVLHLYNQHYRAKGLLADDIPSESLTHYPANETADGA